LSYANEKTQQHTNSADLHSRTCQANILALLLAPIKSYVSLFTALALPSFIPLLQSQTYPTRRSLACEIAQSLIRNGTKISTESNLEAVFEILKVLIKEGQQQPAYTGSAGRRGQESDEAVEEQGWLARIVHLVYSPDNDTQFKVSPCLQSLIITTNVKQLLQIVRKHLGEGGERIRYTSPALNTACLALARRLKQREHLEDNYKSTSQALYKFQHSILSTLYSRCGSSGSTSSVSASGGSSSSVAELTLRLFLTAGQIADQTGFEEISYEFFAQAFTVYEESVSDSRSQFQAVCCIAGALHSTRGFSRENYDTLITKCALHGSKLLKKPDQCRAVCAASHLWWATEVRGREADGDQEEGKEGKEVSFPVSPGCPFCQTSLLIYLLFPALPRRQARP